MRRDLVGLTIVVAATITATYGLYKLLYAVRIPPESLALVVSGIMASIAVVTWFFVIRKSIAKHRPSLNIALIGPPAAGKTVFATVLFRELERGSVGSLLFMPYGTDTIERVRLDLTMMARGRFPDPTVVGGHFYYRAIARFRRVFFDREYRLQLSDFAGEYLATFGEDAVEVDRDFIDSIAECEALFMMIDYEMYARYTSGALASINNRLIAVLNYIALRLNKERAEKIQVPVALLLSKADLLPAVMKERQSEERRILERLKDLREVCESRCRYFKVFFLSATGGIRREEDKGPMLPPGVLRPKGVLEPLLWILGRRMS